MENNKEIIHRREFFRKAVKGLLPIVAFSVLPSSLKATSLQEEQSCPCYGLCTGGCYTSCLHTCDFL